MKLSPLLGAILCIGLHTDFGAAFVPLRSSRSLSTRLFDSGEPLAEEGDWAAYLDEDTTGIVYYFNRRTGVSLWEPPTDSFPSIKLSSKERVVAKRKREDYKQATTEKKEEDRTKGFLGSLFDEAPAEKEEDKKSSADEQPNWFDGIFDDKAGEDQPVAVKEIVKEPEKGGLSFGSLFGTGEEKETTATKKVAEEITEKSPAFSLDSVFGSTKKMESTTQKADPSTKEAIEEKKSIFNLFGGTDTDEILTPAVDKSIKIDMSTFVLPHPAKISWGGEDAVFARGRTFGVFDGVSGAEKLDGVPLYSKTLAEQMKETVGDEALTMKKITSSLREAAEYANKAATGASTAVVASITEDGKLRVLNIGDSVCFVVRDNRIVSRTKERSHYFDCPYQLAEDSPDQPTDGTKMQAQLKQGDVVIMGSDGVFDNLSDEAICEIVSASPERVSLVAKKISDVSRKASLDPEIDTPYARLAKREGYEEYSTGRGGKVDDVSCVVVRCS